MAWNTPISWSAVVVTVANLNQQIRDNMNYVKSWLDGADNATNGFRLTLTTGVPVTSANVTAATTLYCTPYKGNRIALYDSGGVATTYTAAQFSIAIPATTSQMYDVWCYNNAGVPALELLAWTNDTTRATAIVLTTTGTYTKSGDLTRRYLGSVRTTTVSGQTEDSDTKRYLYNYYYRLRKPLLKFIGAATTWTYAVATTWRQANATTTNQVEAVIGVAESTVALQLTVQVSAGGANDAAVAFGLDSTTTVAGNQTITGSHLVSTTGSIVIAKYAAMPAVGYHKFVWLEYVTTTTAVTFNDVFPAAASGDGDGIVGTVDC